MNLTTLAQSIELIAQDLRAAGPLINIVADLLRAFVQIIYTMRLPHNPATNVFTEVERIASNAILNAITALHVGATAPPQNLAASQINQGQH